MLFQFRSRSAYTHSIIECPFEKEASAKIRFSQSIEEKTTFITYCGVPNHQVSICNCSRNATKDTVLTRVSKGAPRIRVFIGSETYLSPFNDRFRQLSGRSAQTLEHMIQKNRHGAWLVGAGGLDLTWFSPANGSLRGEGWLC